MTEKEIKSHIKMCVFSTSEILSVLNVSTLDGLEEKIECQGFSESGKPIGKLSPKYPFVGKVTGYVDLTRVYRVGICLNATRDAKREIVQGKRVFGAEAISIMMQRNGIAFNEPLENLEEKIANLAENGATIYVYKQSSTFNMNTATYQAAGYKDKWIISTKHPVQSVDKWNDFLKIKLKSNWRVKSRAIEKLLASRAIAQLLK